MLCVSTAYNTKRKQLIFNLEDEEHRYGQENPEARLSSGVIVKKVNGMRSKQKVYALSKGYTLRAYILKLS